MTRIAIVGTGSIGRRHASALLALGERDLVAVSEHARREHFDVDGVPLPVAHRFDDVLGSVDVAIICTPTSAHLAQATAAVRAGVHVLVEKPVATTAEGVAGLAHEAAAAGVVIAVGHQFRFNPELLAMQQALRTGRLGVLLSVVADLGEHLADYHPDEDYRSGYAARRELGGGVLLTQIHQIDCLHWLFGPFDEVYAVGGQVSDLEIDVEDCVSFLMRARDGTPVAGHVDYLRRPKRVSLTAIGTEGTLAWDYFGASLTFTPAERDAAPEIQRGTFDRDAMFRAELTDFLGAIRDDRAPRSTLWDGLATLQIVDALKRSMAGAGAVALEPTDGLDRQ